MKEEIKKLRELFDSKIKNIKAEKEWNEVRVEFLGKKGLLTQKLKDLKNYENKQEAGKYLGEAKQYIEDTLKSLKEAIDKEKREEVLKKSKVDINVSGRVNKIGKKNILLKTQREIEEIFVRLGYEVALGQEIETDFYNFEALNLGPDHPARDMQDTFYINPSLLLRTHTSNIQSRVLEANPNKELKIICPGKVYRRDDDDATHSHQFTQIEGLVIVKKDGEHTASLKDLKTKLTLFVREIFNTKELNIRLRPSYFPFTEPSVEVDVSCSQCLGKGCGFCKETGWIEILGAGVVNPKVLEMSGYDSEKFTGYAFGIGVERITLLKYNIDDIRLIYQNYNEFIEQF